MALFSMIFGIVVFAVSLLFGYFFAAALSMSSFLNVLNGTAALKLSELFKLPTADNFGTFITSVLIFGFFGLVIGLGFYMNGLVLKKIERVDHHFRRRRRSEEE